MRTSDRQYHLMYLAIAVLFVLYGAYYIYQTSFVIGGTRYFTLFDDAMISMRYANNFASGFGPVMNPGERVEGVTNPLWMCYMTLLHLLPVSAAKISLLVQLTGLVFHLVLIWLVMKVARMISDDSVLVTTGAMVLTAFYLPLVSWNLQGMEVGLAAVMMTLSALWSIRMLEENSFSPRVFVLLGIATWVRIDLGVPYLATALFLFMALKPHRKRIFIWSAGLLAGFLGAQTILRYAYYGDLLPATYYLKMTGYPVLLRMARGANVFWEFMWQMLPVTFFIPIIALGKEGDRRRWLLIWLFMAQCAYSVYVGGDAWEDWGGANRYISVGMPLYFVVFAAALDRLTRVFLRSLGIQKQAKKRTRRPVVVGFYGVLLIVCGLLMNNNVGPLSLKALIFREPPMLRQGNEQMVVFALAARELTTPEASIAMTWAGALPYFSERYTVDLLGKTDRYLSRIPMRTPPVDEQYTFFYPGHLKYDYAYSFGEKKPDVIFQLWGDLDEARPFIEGNYTQIGIRRWAVYLRLESPNIRWDRIREAATS